MKFVHENWGRRARASRGAIIILTAICAAVLVMVVGLVVDTYRLIVSVRQLQEAADGASFSAAGVLTPDSSDAAEVERKLRVAKETARGVVLRSWMSGATAALSTRVFRYGAPYDQHKTTIDGQLIDPATNLSYPTTDTVEDDNLVMRLERGIWCWEDNAAANGCLNPDPKKNENVGRYRFISIERVPATSPCYGTKLGPHLDPNTYYCRANAVEVTLTIPQFNTTFMQVAGVRGVAQISRTSVATVRTYGTSCGVPTCSSIRAMAPCPSAPSGPYEP